MGLYTGGNVSIWREKIEVLSLYTRANTLILPAAGENFWSDFLGNHESGSYPPPLFQILVGEGGDNYLDMS